MNRKVSYGFTLVELIVVITILAILWTIAFISFQSYARDARDSVRLWDIQTIKRSLDLSFLDNGYYPLPSNGTSITFSGAEVWNQWTIWESVIQEVKRLPEIPLDPLTKTQYTYSLLNTKAEYQVATVLEQWLTTLGNNVYAGNNSGNAYIKWNYNGSLAKVQSWSILYILAVPTLISGDITLQDYQELIDNKRLVYNGYSNLPFSFSGTVFNTLWDFDFNPWWNIVVASGATLPSQGEDVYKFITNTQRVYSGSIIDNQTSILQLLSVSQSDTIELQNLAKNILENTLWAKNVETYISIENGACWSDMWKNLISTPTNLCTQWNSSAVVDNGEGSIFSWSCSGNDVGVSQSCQANHVKPFTQKLRSSVWNTNNWKWIAVDGLWNTYVVGQFEWRIYEESSSNLSNGGYDAYIAKLDNLWNILWIQTIWSSNGEVATKVKLDWNGNVYVIGEYSGTTSFWSTTHTSRNLDSFITKLDSNGTFLWTKKISWWNSDNIYDLAVTSWWGIYVIWKNQDSSAMFWWVSYTTDDFYLAHFDTDGNIQSVKTLGSGISTPELLLSSSGDIYIYGWFTWTRSFWWAAITSAWSVDVFLLKLDNLWNHLFTQKIWWSSSQENIGGITEDWSWNIYLWGTYRSPATFWSTTLTTAYDDGFIIKTNSSWSIIWAKTHYGYINDILYGTWNNLYITWGFSRWINDRELFIQKLDLDWNLISEKLSINSWSTWSRSLSELALDNLWNIYGVWVFYYRATLWDVVLNTWFNGNTIVSRLNLEWMFD